jgi:hypothetical protein
MRSRKMRRRNLAGLVLLMLGLLGVLVGNVSADYWGYGGGLSWVSEVLCWHTSHGRTSYYADGTTGERFIQVDNNLYYDSGSGWTFWCNDYNEKMVSNSDFVEAGCTKFTCASYDWLSASFHGVTLIEPYYYQIYFEPSQGGP